jgi:hypothetical protein
MRQRQFGSITNNFQLFHELTRDRRHESAPIKVRAFAARRKYQRAKVFKRR